MTSEVSRISTVIFRCDTVYPAPGFKTQLCLKSRDKSKLSDEIFSSVRNYFNPVVNP